MVITACKAGCDHSRGRIGICEGHGLPASQDRSTCSCPADDAGLVLRWVADTPMPTTGSITTQIPREIIEAAQRWLYSI